MYRAGLLSRLEHHGTQAGDGGGQHELFAVAGKIFCFDAGGGFGKWIVRVALVPRGKIFFGSRRGDERRQENFLGGLAVGVFGNKFRHRSFLRANSRNKTQRNNFRAVCGDIHGRGLLATDNLHDAACL